MSDIDKLLAQRNNLGFSLEQDMQRQLEDEIMMSLTNQSTPTMMNAHSQPDIDMHSFQDGGYTMELDNLSNPPSQIFESPMKEDVPRVAVLEQELRDSRQQVMEERSKNQNYMKMITMYEEMVKSYKAVNAQNADLIKAKEEENAQLRGNSQNTLQKQTSERRYLRTMATLAEKLQNNGLLSLYYSKKYEEWKQALNKCMPEGAVLEADEDNESASLDKLNFAEALVEQPVSGEPGKPNASATDEPTAIEEQVTKEPGKSENCGAAKEVAATEEQETNDVGKLEASVAVQEVVAFEEQTTNEAEGSAADEPAAIEVTKEPGKSDGVNCGAAKEVAATEDQDKEVVAFEEQNTNEPEASGAEEVAAIEEPATEELGKPEDSIVAKIIADIVEQANKEPEASVTAEKITAVEEQATKEPEAAEEVDEKDTNGPVSFETEEVAFKELADDELSNMVDSDSEEENIMMTPESMDNNTSGELTESLIYQTNGSYEEEPSNETAQFVLPETEEAAEKVAGKPNATEDSQSNDGDTVSTDESDGSMDVDEEIDLASVEDESENVEEQPLQKPAKIEETKTDENSVLPGKSVQQLEIDSSSEDEQQEKNTMEADSTSKLNADEDEDKSTVAKEVEDKGARSPVKNQTTSTEETVAQEEKEAATSVSRKGSRPYTVPSRRSMRKKSRTQMYSSGDCFEFKKPAVEKIQNNAGQTASNQVEESNKAGKDKIPLELEDEENKTENSTGLDSKEVSAEDKSDKATGEISKKVKENVKVFQKNTASKGGKNSKVDEETKSKVPDKKKKAVQAKKKAPGKSTVKAIQVEEEAKSKVPENSKEKVVQGKKKASGKTTKKGKPIEIGEKTKSEEAAKSAKNEGNFVGEEMKKAPRKSDGKPKAKKVAAADLPSIGTMRASLKKKIQGADKLGSSDKQKNQDISSATTPENEDVSAKEAGLRSGKKKSSSAASTSNPKKMRLESPTYSTSFGPIVFSPKSTGGQVTKPMMLYAVPYNPQLHKEQELEVQCPSKRHQTKRPKKKEVKSRQRVSKAASDAIIAKATNSPKKHQHLVSQLKAKLAKNHPLLRKKIEY